MYVYEFSKAQRSHIWSNAYQQHIRIQDLK